MFVFCVVAVNVGEDCPVFDGLFEFCQLSTGGSAGRSLSFCWKFLKRLEERKPLWMMILHDKNTAWLTTSVNFTAELCESCSLIKEPFTPLSSILRPQHYPDLPFMRRWCGPSYFSSRKRAMPSPPMVVHKHIIYKSHKHFTPFRAVS